MKSEIIEAIREFNNYPLRRTASLDTPGHSGAIIPILNGQKAYVTANYHSTVIAMDGDEIINASKALAMEVKFGKTVYKQVILITCENGTIIRLSTYPR